MSVNNRKLKIPQITESPNNSEIMDLEYNNLYNHYYNDDDDNNNKLYTPKITELPINSEIMNLDYNNLYSHYNNNNRNNIVFFDQINQPTIDNSSSIDESNNNLKKYDKYEYNNSNLNKIKLDKQDLQSNNNSFYLILMILIILIILIIILNKK